MIKFKFFPTRVVYLTFVVSCILPSTNLLAQTRLFIFPYEEGKILSTEQQEKYRLFEQQNTTAHIELIRIGELLPSLHSQILLVNLPDLSAEYIAKSIQVMYDSPDEFVWHGDLTAVNGHMILVNSHGKFTGVIEFDNNNV